MTDSTAITTEACVARGADYMDRYYPGWERKIDAATLNVSLEPCIMDQCAEGWFPGRRLFFERLYGGDEPLGALGSHGFSGDRDVTDAWIALVNRRLNAGVLSDG